MASRHTRRCGWRYLTTWKVKSWHRARREESRRWLDRAADRGADAPDGGVHAGAKNPPVTDHAACRWPYQQEDKEWCRYDEWGNLLNEENPHQLSAYAADGGAL
ncbi:hypothetical protein [Escherichia coli]|uniref:hypothetical protein n=1 Tax=Escherichia coli TaxID=562 RepID=UPI000D1A5519